MIFDENGCIKYTEAIEIEQKNLTAKFSLFVRAYHNKNFENGIFNDGLAEKVLGSNDYNEISENLINGINFFNPDFNGTKAEALRWIVNNQLSPSVLARSAFCEKSLNNAVKLGCRQYLKLAAGYDTPAYRIPEIKTFEVDMPQMIEDKLKRLKRADIDYKNTTFVKCDLTSKDFSDIILNSGFDKNKTAFCSILGLSYYFKKEDFFGLLKELSEILPDYSTITFDYPTDETDKASETNRQLANGAGEEMKSRYSYREIESALEKGGFLIYEHLNSSQMTDNFFENFNKQNPNDKMYAPNGVNYCLAVKNI